MSFIRQASSGHYEQLIADRARVLATCPSSHRRRILGLAPRYRPAKTHEITINLKTGELVGVKTLGDTDIEQEVILISKNGQTIRLAIKDIPSLGRATQGVRIMRLNDNDEVVIELPGVIQAFKGNAAAQ